MFLSTCLTYGMRVGCQGPFQHKIEAWRVMRRPRKDSKKPLHIEDGDQREIAELRT